METTAGVTTLEVAVRTLAERRREVRLLQAEVAERRQELEQMFEARRLAEAEARLKDAVAALEAADMQTRELAVAVYRDTLNKRPVAGVEVRLFRRLVYDRCQVLDWCRLNAPALLTVDWAAFTKTALGLPGAPVTVEDEPRAFITADLEVE